ncbi:cation transporter [Scytonema hofmannii PCC 7110]|uniref:Cation transporter n=1 Tax=Scytonema hofmannii PCC 7110 TaxID=128403 RepID=A0A139WPZ1_9CYAN|nr:cation transporter [Scytonema hofmannii]KYC34488.1 cation transporter [Scytonema hofmannii PCC 7110]
MGDCCQNKACELSNLRKQQSKVLWTVLLINSVMFFVELGAGIKSASLSLTGDSLDMLGDALVYATSLYVINKGSKAQAGSALLKGIIMFLSAVAVFARAWYQLFVGTTPEVRVMSAVGLIALLANLLCLYLLTRHRNDNINMSSVWLCSRNDIIANTSVLGAAGLVFLTGSLLPDFIVGLLLTFVFAKSAGLVLLQSWRILQQA